jgi:hypothetical protein
MSKGRPFFKINDDTGNPINQLTEKLLGFAGRQGKQKGDSRSTDPRTNQKYPKGFTPPVDFYTEEAPKKSAKEEKEGGKLPESETNIRGGQEITPGMQNDTHKEYGISLTKGGEVIGAGPNKKISGFVSGRNPNVVIKPEDLEPSKFYVNPDNLQPGKDIPVEYGIKIDSPDINQGIGGAETFITTPSKKTDYRREFLTYNNNQNLNFIHLLDYYHAEDEFDRPTISRIKAADNSTISSLEPIRTDLSWTKTFRENEDPTILGVDLEIRVLDSPLFNGDIVRFLDIFGNGYTELESRKELYEGFKSQIYKFISPNIFIGDEKTGPIPDPTQNKSYYLQGISGLDNLVESPTSDGKYFVDYGKDIITLEFLEDVSQSMGYLSSLYKAMSYSRRNGKDLIPRNLLRFDIDITITEMRPYVRSVKMPQANQPIFSYRDEISRYTYTLYDCRFLFDKMPHGDEVKNNETNFLNNFKLSFDYKYSTLNFKKYSGVIGFTGTVQRPVAFIEYFDINNVLAKPVRRTEKTVSPDGTTIQNEGGLPLTTKLGYYNSIDKSPLIHGILIENTEELSPRSVNPQVFSDGQLQPDAESIKLNQLQVEDEKNKSRKGKVSAFFKQAKNALGKSKAFDSLKRGLANAAINEVNRRILSQAALLNKTIDNIRNSVGLGRMSEPTNVYDPQLPFVSDIKNTFRDALGKSVKSFFQSL